MYSVWVYGVGSRQRLRSSSRRHLVVPRHRRSTLGRRAFFVAGPMALNALPDDLRDPSLSADNFRKTLKTHLFRNALETLSALEALRNALYKFKTYLLTYLWGSTSLLFLACKSRIAATYAQFQIFGRLIHGLNLFYAVPEKFLTVFLRLEIKSDGKSF